MGTLRKAPETGRRKQRAAVKRTVRTLLSPEQLKSAIARETARVDRRSAGDLSVVLFRIPGWRRHSLSAVRLARTILQRIRITDDLGWFDPHHLGLVLPDTHVQGAWALAQEVCQIAATRGPRPQCIMYTYPVDEEPPDSQAAHHVIRSSELIDPPAIKVAS